MGACMSNDPVWFVHVQDQQLGPFSKVQLYQQFQENQFQLDILLFREGWKEWKPVMSCLHDLGFPLQIDGKCLTMREQRRKGPRISIAGQIIVHNQGNLAVGTGVNLSATGLFVETDQQLFRVGEKLILTCKVTQLPAPFHAKAEVIRFNKGTDSPTGFGLKWTEIPPDILQQIQELTGAKKTGVQTLKLPPVPTKKVM